jgi:hypothetical protein
MQTPSLPNDPPGFSSVYIANVLYPSAPVIDYAELIRHVKRRLPNAHHFGGGAGTLARNDLLAFAHPDQTFRVVEGNLPVQTVIIPAGELTDRATLEAAAPQCRQWPEVRSVVARCGASVMVNDMFCRGLAPVPRLRLHHAVLLSLIEVAPPILLHFLGSDKLVEPGAFARGQAPGADKDELNGAVNVRMFNVSNDAGVMLMDTLGLAALGLPDVQCHFRDLDPGRVAGLLYGIANYLFENGDVIESGHTLDGITPGDKWRAQHEEALVEPRRVVLDIDPGPTYAAGGRER